MGSGSAGKEGGPFKALLRQQTQSALEQRGGSPHRFCRRREFPFLTLTAFPPGLLVHVGGVVSARSVKLLDRIHNPAFVGIMGNTRSYKLLDWNSFNSDEPETRDAWWAEIRQEIKSHAKALGCHAVVGYSESTSICEEVCILSASGTAAVLNPRFLQEGTVEGCLEQRIEENLPVGCGFCHIPYDELNMPFPAHLTYCYNCRKQKVPDVLFTTIDLPTDAVVVGKGCLIQARLCRLKKKAQAEANATAISNLLPFMEYEVHTQLMNKLKLKGMNALFGLRIQITVGETMLMGLASATGVYLAALPTPGGIQIAGKTPNDGSYEQHISHMQKKINDTIAKNKELYEINPPEVSEEMIGSPIPEPRQRSRLLRSQSESSDEVTELDLSHGKKDAFVLEIDDTDAMEDVHSLLTDAPPPSGFYSCNTEIMPGINNWTSEIQMFTSVRVVRLSSLNLTNQALNKNFNGLCENLLKSLYFKLRSMTPCCLCHVNFTVSLPEDELIQVTVTAVAITFDKNQALQTTKPHVEKSLQRASTDNEELLQFPLELCSDSLPPHPFPAAKGWSPGSLGGMVVSPLCFLSQSEKSALHPIIVCCSYFTLQTVKVHFSYVPFLCFSFNKSFTFNFPVYIFMYICVFGVLSGKFSSSRGFYLDFHRVSRGMHRLDRNVLPSFLTPETEFLCVALGFLELPLKTRLALNSLCLPSAGIKGV